MGGLEPPFRTISFQQVSGITLTVLPALDWWCLPYVSHSEGLTPQGPGPLQLVLLELIALHALVQNANTAV